MRIVFMGTPEIAAQSLKALIKAGHEIVGVFTQPDKPVGRKQILTPPAVKVVAQQNNIPVYQPVTLRDGKSTEIIKSLNPELIAVVAYGKILPKEILDIAPKGCVNGHASLLPKYRGSSPIQWCIVCGETKTGVTTMLMDEGMDTGDMLDKAEVCIENTDNADTLYDKLSVCAADLMCKTIEKIANNTATRTKQDNEQATYAPIIKKEMAFTDFSENAQAICNKVRGFYSWPTVYFMMNGKRIKIYVADVSGSTDKPCGTVISNQNELVIACGENTSISIKEIQAEGGKRMDIHSFLSGNRPPLGSIITD